MNALRRRYGLVIVGGGPAGLAPLVAASRDGRLDDLLARGVVVIEQSSAIGAGRLGRYAINSDSTADTFLSAITGHLDPRLGTLLDTKVSRILRSKGRETVPLTLAAALMADVGRVLTDAIIETGGQVITFCRALGSTQRPGGGWSTQVRRLDDGADFIVESDAVVLATGGDQNNERLRADAVAGLPLVPHHASKVLWSDHVLRQSGLRELQTRLRRSAAPKVAIVGGSTSALATAALLLRSLPDETRADGSITVLHRRPLRVFYPSVDAALADGYDEFTPEDVCPLSGFVYRLAGFRLESRELLLRLRQINGRPPEPRCRLHRIRDGVDSEALGVIEEADVVVAALGYRPRALPLYDASGHRIALRGVIGAAPLVDRRCRIVAADGEPVGSVFSIGLASGFVPHGKLGGEPSFVGQANGLWLWQTAVGALIVDQVLPDAVVAAFVDDDQMATVGA